MTPFFYYINNLLSVNCNWSSTPKVNIGYMLLRNDTAVNIEAASF